MQITDKCTITKISTALPPYLPGPTMDYKYEPRSMHLGFIKKKKHLYIFSLVHYGALSERSRTYMSSRRVLWCDWRESREFSRCRLTAAKGDEAQPSHPAPRIQFMGKSLRKHHFFNMIKGCFQGRVRFKLTGSSDIQYY